mmetsp:Transcript_3181/g.13008  ORF Transcript_3181/g.13008 Transcript_3181/m.13008 type:complete len:598 (-) Transcript_3181:1827-3620(-)
MRRSWTGRAACPRRRRTPRAARRRGRRRRRRSRTRRLRRRERPKLRPRTSELAAALTRRRGVSQGSVSINNQPTRTSTCPAGGSEPGKLGEVHDALGERRDRVHERHAVAPELGLLRHDEHLIEERLRRLGQARSRRQQVTHRRLGVDPDLLPRGDVRLVQRHLLGIHQAPPLNLEVGRELLAPHQPGGSREHGHRRLELLGTADDRDVERPGRHRRRRRVTAALREHRAHSLHAAPAVDQVLLQAPGHVLEAFVHHLIAALHRLERRSLRQRRAQVAPRVGRHQSLNRTVSGAPKAERICRRLGGADDREETREGIEPVGDGDGDTRGGGGEDVAGRPWEGSLEDGLAQGRVESLASGVVLAHDARQGRELLNELGGEVRAGECGSLGRNLGVRLGEAQGRGELGRQLLYALRLLEHGTELSLEGDPREIGLEVHELPAGVSLVEELGILVPGLEHRLVTRADDVGVDGSVGDGDEMREEVARGSVLHGEVPLVLAHDHDQNLLGKLEERRVEAADDGRGRLDQVNNLVDQTAGLAGGGRDDAVHARRELFGGGPDGGAARVEADLDRVALEELGVVSGAGDLRRGRRAVAHEARG